MAELERSKVTLIIISCLGLGFFGIDRMYAGQIG
jgi:TM2 domain-containing membrane protein YozV